MSQINAFYGKHATYTTVIPSLYTQKSVKPSVNVVTSGEVVLSAVSLHSDASQEGVVVAIVVVIVIAVVVGSSSSNGSDSNRGGGR